MLASIQNFLKDFRHSSSTLVLQTTRGNDQRVIGMEINQSIFKKIYNFINKKDDCLLELYVKDREKEIQEFFFDESEEEDDYYFSEYYWAEMQ